ncbi:MAG: 50S ribosomal protein L4 [Candidatus Competibacteraceae bacterium]|jgi:large subunit ribosomal protein L4|nr:50S ribosomal protein L4 [Candidatus Competibacteraceae bacterium]
MELPIQSTQEQAAADTIVVADEIFAREFNQSLIHQVVVAHMAGARAGTRAQKTRSEVRGGGAKPWRQKGTGRARAGTIRSPLWRGGGVTFAAKPQDHGQKVNKKMYRAAMRAILSELVRQDRLLIVEELSIDTPKTKVMLTYLDSLGIGNSALLVTADPLDNNLYLSARNLPYIDVCNVSALNPVNLIRFDKVILTKAGLQQVGEWLT